MRVQLTRKEYSIIKKLICKAFLFVFFWCFCFFRFFGAFL